RALPAVGSAGWAWLFRRVDRAATSLSGGDFDLHLARLGVLADRQLHGQHAVLVLSCHLAGIDRRRKRERPAERPVTPLDPVELLLLHLRRELLLALDRE